MGSNEHPIKTNANLSPQSLVSLFLSDRYDTYDITANDYRLQWLVHSHKAVPPLIICRRTLKISLSLSVCLCVPLYFKWGNFNYCCVDDYVYVYIYIYIYIYVCIYLLMLHTICIHTYTECSILDKSQEHRWHSGEENMYELDMEMTMLLLWTLRTLTTLRLTLGVLLHIPIREVTATQSDCTTLRATITGLSTPK